MPGFADDGRRRFDGVDGAPTALALSTALLVFLFLVRRVCTQLAVSFRSLALLSVPSFAVIVLGACAVFGFERFLSVFLSAAPPFIMQVNSVSACQTKIEINLPEIPST